MHSLCRALRLRFGASYGARSAVIRRAHTGTPNSRATFTVKSPPSGVETINSGEIVGEKEDSTGVVIFATEMDAKGGITRRLKVGDSVKEDDVVAIIVTAKAAINVHAPDNGTVEEFLVEPNAEVAMPGHQLIRFRVMPRRTTALGPVS